MGRERNKRLTKKAHVPEFRDTIKRTIRIIAMIKWDSFKEQKMVPYIQTSKCI